MSEFYKHKGNESFEPIKTGEEIPQSKFEEGDLAVFKSDTKETEVSILEAKYNKEILEWEYRVVVMKILIDNYEQLKIGDIFWPVTDSELKKYGE